MHHANEQRMAAFGKGQEHEKISISQYWEQELKSMPYLTCKLVPESDFELYFLLHVHDMLLDLLAVRNNSIGS